MSTALQIQESKSISLFPSEHEWAMLKEQASMVVKTGFLPMAIKTAEQAIAIALKGRELGIPPMHAFAHIHIIQGKPTVSAELMLALIFKNCPGAVINYPETNSEVCVISAKRPGGTVSSFKFTIAEAKLAGLLNKDSWKNYPAAMLRARTVSMVARALFPDAIMGCSYTPEEMGAEVNEELEVINLPHEPGVVAPEQPPEGELQESTIWRFGFGQWRTRTVEQVYRDEGPARMASYIEYLEKTAEKKKEPLGKGAQEAIEQIESFLAAMENPPEVES